MTMKTLWSKVEPILWTGACVYLIYFVLGAIADRTKTEAWMRIPGVPLVLVGVTAFWWVGFKNRLAKFLRDSFREMIVQELQESRIAFVTWLREDAPWRGENPFLPPPEEPE